MSLIDWADKHQTQIEHSHEQFDQLSLISTLLEDNIYNLSNHAALVPSELTLSD